MSERLRRDAFPPHRVHGGWLAALFALPPLALLMAPDRSIEAVLITVAWLAIPIPLAWVAILDWARSRPKRQSRASAALRAAARVATSGLGGLGLFAGLWVLWEAFSLADSRGESLGTLAVRVGLGLAVCICGVHLARLANTQPGRDRHFGGA